MPLLLDANVELSTYKTAIAALVAILSECSFGQAPPERRATLRNMQADAIQKMGEAETAVEEFVREANSSI